jgi:hypothetical protein
MNRMRRLAADRDRQLAALAAEREGAEEIEAPFKAMVRQDFAPSEAK